MTKSTETKREVVILFAGDSGDGIQLTGGQFSETTGLYGNDISTFPNFPAEIRAPKGTLAGVSGFQLKFGSVEIFTPGDKYDVLVAMNAAALKVNLENLKTGGLIIANTDGFDKKNLNLAKYADGENPLEDHSLDKYIVHKIDVTKITRNALKGSGLGIKEIDRSKNMFVLGYIYWMYNRKLDNTIAFINQKFKNNEQLREANINVLKTGYHFGDTSEAFTSRYQVEPAPMPKGIYRNIKGNEATAIGLIAGAKKAGLNLFYGSYPITPASDILHFLSKYKNFKVKTFQAEDEIAAICSAIGASYGGTLGVTASSGPGIALKGEAIGLATILELPLVICNVQRGGPSTGLPTKTEQADLFQAVYGRNGEAPVPVLAASSPSDCFEVAFEACRIALEHMTPVFVLSDGYIANGAEPWRFPKSEALTEIHPKWVNDNSKNEEGKYLPYKRDEKLVREWAIPGMKGFEHRIGGLEKEHETGNVSYDPANHEFMINLRAEKVKKMAEFLPEQQIAIGESQGDVLVLGWGSTFGAIQTAVRELRKEGHSVSHAHLRYVFPFPKNLKQLLSRFKKVVIPEMNKGQLLQMIRSEFLIDAKGVQKVKGLPFTVDEIKNAVLGENTLEAVQ
ncbi:2-oxoacid:acceptor oxidoreductase subunit alpha [Flexithrix dorotheae]|uniref:2-oxoacid:acceptor oxidoreductase subunit alpha n=1 Tax=Flexithrix dorotheae TaxID=70993 RepID=UPI00036C3054|nr:2-oxoacid:acceptor oxidoreductase subunit alpha [Flexithrix dorotheae]